MQHFIRKNSRQIGAICRLTLKMRTRFKFNLVIGIISSLISILFPIFLFSFLFGNMLAGRSVGVFSAENYVNLIFLGFCGGQFSSFFGIYPVRFRAEKKRETLPALIVAPLNRLNLLSGIFISHLIMILPVFSVIFTLNILFSPVYPSIGIILLILLIYFLYGFSLAGIGLVLGVLVISKQNLTKIFTFIYSMITIFNCVTFPKEIFPEALQPIVELNPFYHVFELVRNLWVFGDVFYQGNLVHFGVIIPMAIFSPIVGIYLFNKIYDRYGIKGV